MTDKKRLAHTGKVKVPRYGVMREGILYFVDKNREDAWFHAAQIGGVIVRLSGTVTYTLAK